MQIDVTGFKAKLSDGRVILTWRRYRRGDFVDLGRGPARVQEVHAKTLSLRMLSDGRSVTVPRDQVLPAQVVAKRQDARQMMVVSVVRDEALLLDPVTNKTHEVRLPDDIEYDLSIRHLDVIEHDVKRLDRLISDISDASRLDAELQRQEAAPVDFANLLEALVKAAPPAASGGTAP